MWFVGPGRGLGSSGLQSLGLSIPERRQEMPWRGRVVLRKGAAR